MTLVLLVEVSTREGGILLRKPASQRHPEILLASVLLLALNLDDPIRQRDRVVPASSRLTFFDLCHSLPPLDLQ